MQKEKIIEILRNYKNGSISDEDVFAYIKNLPYEDLSFARIDHHREMRWGFPEVIFSQGKTPEQVAIIAEKIIQNGSNLLATRASREVYDAVRIKLPEASYNETGKIISRAVKKITKLAGKVIIVTAGTSDIPAGTEALETGNMLGLDISMICDVGVAGIHRVMNHRDELDKAAIVIVFAGMEGALASVIAGLISSPVIAVPTSVGYGASFNGLTPLLGMLNSCVPGVA
ncbi:MAG: nickel pincer cofactor biosynthesis protein LarB, partial [Spirochaetes bacterium]|nr:nickel pincer cofactor biosynthesis protein LarB [Spirochaetota bacterium]